MKYSEHVESFISFITKLGRQDKERVIRNSCLIDRDCEMLVLRYVHGFTIQESADRLGMEYDAFVKAQRKAIERFYSNSFPKQFHSA